MRAHQLADPSVDIDVAFAHVDPPDGNALRHAPDRRIAYVAVDGDRAEEFEGEMWIFEHPKRVTRIQADAENVATHVLYQRFQFASLKIAAMVLHGQLDSRFADLRAHALQHTCGV